VWAAEKIKGRLLPLLLAAVCCFMAWLGWSQARPDPVPLQTSITYDVRVTVLSPGQVPVDDARVWSSRGGEPKKVDGGWEFDINIPRNEIPAKLTVWASVDSKGWSGSQDLMLNEDHSVPAGIQLAAKGEVPISGMIVDEDGNSIANALVWIVGNGKDVRNSDGTGNFELSSHALPGAIVTLHAEKPPLLPAEKDYVVGSGAARLTLRAASRPVPRGNQMHGNVSNAGRVPGSDAAPPGNQAPAPNQAGASSSPATANAGQCESFAQFAGDENALATLSEKAFSRQSYDCTILDLEQAQKVQSSGVWERDYPLLAASYLLVRKDRNLFQDTLQGMLGEMRRQGSFLHHGPPMGMAMRNLSDVRFYLDPDAQKYLDGVLAQATSIRQSLPN
ncbi:MAG: carboxypeptidase-like regulatory domain-containing protein, partial [Terracidiphilus sp.]